MRVSFTVSTSLFSVRIAIYRYASLSSMITTIAAFCVITFARKIRLYSLVQGRDISKRSRGERSRGVVP